MRTTVTDILPRPVTSRNQQSMPLLLGSRLGALAVKSKILGFLEGVTGAISEHLPGGRNGKNPAPRKTSGARKRSTSKTRTDKKLKTRRFRSRTSRNGSLRKKLKAAHALTDRSSLTPPAQTTVYSCPTCGLQATQSSMLEHLLGSPLHQPGRVQPEETRDQKVEDKQAAVSLNGDRDSLRNLLQILLPPRPFGRRHEQKIVKV